MKKNLLKFCALILAVSSLLMSGCSKSEGTDQGGQAADKPSLSSALSAQGQQAAANAALPKANANTPLDQYVRLTSGHQLMFMYYGLSNMPVDYEKIADVYSKEYRSTNDAFQKQDILKALKPRIDSEIAKSKNVRYILNEDDARLSSYDFNAKGFQVNNAIGADAFGYFYDNNAYRYSYTNGDDFKMLKVTDESKARQIESLSKNYAGLKFVYYAYVQDIDPSNMTIKCQIVKIRLLDARGNELLVQ